MSLIYSIFFKFCAYNNFWAQWFKMIFVSLIGVHQYPKPLCRYFRLWRSKRVQKVFGTLNVSGKKWIKLRKSQTKYKEWLVNIRSFKCYFVTKYPGTLNSQFKNWFLCDWITDFNLNKELRINIAFRVTKIPVIFSFYFFLSLCIKQYFT